MTNKSKSLQSSDFLLWVLLLVPLFFLPSSRDVFNFPKVVLMTSLVVGFCLHVALGPKGQTRNQHIELKVVSAVLVGLALCLIASGLMTETSFIRSVFGYPGRANGVLTYLSLIILVWLGSRLQVDEEFKAKLTRYLLLLMVLFLIYSFVQFLGLDPIKWNNPYNKIIGTFGNPNFSGAFLGISGVAFLQFSLAVKSHWRFFLFLLLGISVFLGYSTESFQSILIFAVGLTIMILMHLKRVLRLRVFILTACAFLFSGLFAFMSFLGFGPLGAQLFQPTLKLRLEYWKVGIDTANAYPILGIGPDSYAEGWRLFRSPEFVKTYSESVSVDSAHNVLINFMANFGIPAFICLLTLYIVIAKNALNILFSSDQEKPIARVISLMWVLLVIQSLFSLEQIGLNTIQWALGALLINPHFRSEGNAKSNEELSRGSRAAYRGFSARGEVAIVTVVLSFTAFLPFLQQEIGLNKVIGIAVDINTPREPIEQELSKFGEYSKLEMGRAIVLSDFLLRAERYEEAASLVEKARSQEPRSYEATEQLARLAGYKKDFSQEIQLRRQIESFDPQNYKNLVSLAEVLRIQGDLVMAKSYAERVLTLSNDIDVNKIAADILKESK